MLIAGLESTTLITLWLLMIKQPINKEYKVTFSSFRSVA